MAGRAKGRRQARPASGEEQRRERAAARNAERRAKLDTDAEELRSLRAQGAHDEHGLEGARAVVAIRKRYTFDAERDPEGELLLREVGRCVDRVAEARELVARQGLVLQGARGQDIAHPALAVERSARLQLIQALKALGLESVER